jgi:hypothetical protein
VFRPVARKLGLGLAGIGANLALLCVFLTLPPFKMGIWYQSEPVLAGLHLSSGLCALGLGLAALGRPGTARAFLHPLSLIPFGMAAWSLVAGAFQDLPLRGWFGSPEVGEGLLWYLCLGVLSASALVLSRIPPWRRVLVGTALVSVGAVGAMTLLWNLDLKSEWVPYYFPDYVAFFGVFLIGAVAGLVRKGFALPLAVLAGFAVVSLSQNWTAYGLVFIGGTAVWAFFRFLPVSATAARRLAAAAGIAAPLAVTAALVPSGYDDLAKQQNLPGRLANSVLSRHHLADIVLETVKEKPGILVFGQAWGSYSDSLAINIPMEWAVLRDDAAEARETGKWWDAIHRVDFHSHDYVLEALLGGGVPAVALTIAITGLLPLWARRRHLPLAAALAVVTGGLAAFWFQFAVSLPLFAVAWAAVARPAGWPAGWKIATPTVVRTLAGGMAATGIFLGYMGLTGFLFARYAYYFHPAMPAPLYADGQRRPCAAPFDDQGRGGIHLAHRLKSFTTFTVRSLRNEAEEKPGDHLAGEHVERLRGLFCATEEYLERGASVRLLVTSLLIRSDLAFAPSNPKIEELRREILANWEPRLTEALRIAPSRTDLAAPYLLWLLAQNRSDTFKAWAERLYRRAPGDPVGLWFSGIANLDDPARAPEGVARMKAALAKGIERFIPVEAELKRELGQ